MNLLDLDTIFDNDRTTVPRPPDVTPDDLPTEWREVYCERAAIRESSSGMPRELAEYFALLDTLEQMKLWHQYPKS